jgi:transcriptional regulator with XRE-family HTH domain
VQANLVVRIKHIRLLKGINQYDIGQAVGLTQAAYSNIENGKRGLTIDMFVKITRQLEVDPGILLNEVLDDELLDKWPSVLPPESPIAIEDPEEVEPGQLGRLLLMGLARR